MSWVYVCCTSVGKSIVVWCELSRQRSGRNLESGQQGATTRLGPRFVWMDGRMTDNGGSTTGELFRGLASGNC